MRRIHKNHELMRRVKFVEGEYEGILIGKYSATLRALQRAAALQSEDIDRSINPVEGVARGLDRLVTELLIASGFTFMSLGPDQTIWHGLVEALCAGHFSECGSVKDLYRNSQAPGFWSWPCNADCTCCIDRAEIEEPYHEASPLFAQGADPVDLQTIYSRFGGLQYPIGSRCRENWCRGFINGLASVYDAIHDRIEKEPDALPVTNVGANAQAKNRRASTKKGKGK